MARVVNNTRWAHPRHRIPRQLPESVPPRSAEGPRQRNTLSTWAHRAAQDPPLQQRPRTVSESKRARWRSRAMYSSSASRTGACADSYRRPHANCTRGTLRGGGWRAVRWGVPKGLGQQRGLASAVRGWSRHGPLRISASSVTRRTRSPIGILKH